MDPASHKKKPGSHATQRPQPSTTDLLSSAKVVADAAKASLRHKPDGVDKGRVAGAAADLLGAAAHYGKLEEKSAGKYVEKAESYLREYHSSHTAAGAQSSSFPSSHSPPPHSGGEGHSATTAAAGGGGGGYGEYIKMAEGLLKKH